MAPRPSRTYPAIAELDGRSATRSDVPLAKVLVMAQPEGRRSALEHADKPFALAGEPGQPAL